MDRESAINVIRASPLGKDADRLIADLFPSLRIRTRKATYELRPGESRFGGCPDLPQGFQWPRGLGSATKWDAKKKRSIRMPQKEVLLHFVAQLSLEDLPDFSDRKLLPARGWLCFFYDFEHQPWGYDPADRMGWKVLYFDVPAARLVRTELPQLTTQFASHLCQVSFTLEWTLPDYEALMDSHSRDTVWYDGVKDLFADLNGGISFDRGMHRLLGHAQHIQGDMKVECQLVSNGLNWGDGSWQEDPRSKGLIAGAKDWRLLLQVDTDEDGPGWMWGDGGMIYYLIREADLRRQAFDAAWFVLQCC
jgi:uncharacterized protein YwqG